MGFRAQWAGLCSRHPPSSSRHSPWTHPQPTLQAPPTSETLFPPSLSPECLLFLLFPPLALSHSPGLRLLYLILTPYHLIPSKRKKFFSALLGSSGWFKNEIDMRQINKRKTNKSLITCIHGRDPGKRSNLPKNDCLKYHLQLQPKEDVEGTGLGLQKGGGNSHGDGKANAW